jgi:acetyltransferase-like isoleucine patch superfamily enzyme
MDREENMRKLILKESKKFRLRFSRFHTWLLRSSFESMGEGVRIDFPNRIEEPGSISVGDHCVFYARSWINPVSEWAGRRYNGKIKLGNRVMVGYNSQISAAASIVIEDDVTVAGGVTIVDHVHESHHADTSIFLATISEPQPVHIGRRAFLGVHCFIGPGVQIGEQAVIAANAVVTKNVPAYCVAVGNPARVIRLHDVTKTDNPQPPAAEG